MAGTNAKITTGLMKALWQAQTLSVLEKILCGSNNDKQKNCKPQVKQKGLQKLLTHSEAKLSI